MSSADLMGEYLAGVLAAQPDSPRRVDMASLALMMVRRGYWTLVGLGLLFILSGPFLGGGFTSMFSFIPLLGGLFVWGLVLRDGVRYYRALKFGRLAEAHVLSVKTGDAQYADHAWIRARVLLLDEPFEADLTFTRSWVRELVPGSRLQVLVDPAKPKVLFTVGRS